MGRALTNNHLLIINYPNDRRIRQVVDEYLQDDDHAGDEIVLVTDQIESLPPLLDKKIQLVEGNIVNVEEQGFRLGTSITVSNLFENFPARRKFLNSAGSESSKIVSVCSKYAMAYPDVAWNLTLGDKNKFATPGNGQLKIGRASCRERV